MPCGGMPALPFGGGVFSGKRGTEALQRPGNLALLRSRALERVGISHAGENPVIREVLESYTERAFYTLFNLINRIEGLPVSGKSTEAAAGIVALRMRCGKHRFGHTRQPAPGRD